MNQEGDVRNQPPSVQFLNHVVFVKNQGEYVKFLDYVADVRNLSEDCFEPLRLCE